MASASVAVARFPRLQPLLRACCPTSGPAQERLAAQWLKVPERELALELSAFLGDPDALMAECSWLFQESGEGERMPTGRLYEVTQRLIFCLGSRDEEVLDRVAQVYMAATRQGLSGVCELEFRGLVAAVLTQILRELEARCGAKAQKARSGALAPFLPAGHDRPSCEPQGAGWAQRFADSLLDRLDAATEGLEATLSAPDVEAAAREASARPRVPKACLDGAAPAPARLVPALPEARGERLSEPDPELEARGRGQSGRGAGPLCCPVFDAPAERRAPAPARTVAGPAMWELGSGPYRGWPGFGGPETESREVVLESEGLPAYVAVGQVWVPSRLVTTGGRYLHVVQESVVACSDIAASVPPDCPCFELCDLQQVTRRTAPGRLLLSLHLHAGTLLLRFSFASQREAFLGAILADGRRLPVVDVALD